MEEENNKTEPKFIFLIQGQDGKLYEPLGSMKVDKEQPTEGQINVTLSVSPVDLDKLPDAYLK